MNKTEIIRIIVLSMLAIFLMISCDDKSGKADAYGNFEIESIVLSSPLQWECLYFNTEEGDKVSKGDTRAVTDTTDINLQIRSPEMQKNAVKAKFSSVTARTEVQKGKRNTLRKDEKKNDKRLIPIKHQNDAYFHFVLYACFAVISALTIEVSKFICQSF